MRVKYVMNQLEVGERLKIVYERITLTRFTKTFMLIALAHCLVQIALQATAFTFNTRANRVVDLIITEADIQQQYSFVQNGRLFVCSGVPMSGDPFDSVCWAFDGPGVAPPNMTVETLAGSANKSESRTSKIGTRDLSAVPTFGDSGDMVAVKVTGLNDENPDEEVTLSARCVTALNWPNHVLRDASREDICFLVFQIWLLGISLVTVLNESIPHLITAVITHGLSTAWSAFQVSRTGRNQFEYHNLIVNDACNGVDVIPNFWNNRLDYFIPILVLNAIALFLSLGVSVKLFHVYTSQTFKRVGASKKMSLLYLYVLLLSVFLQLSAFFTICASALWIDILSNGALTGRAVHRIIFSIACAVEFPWVILGWLSFRREHRVWSLVFIIIGFMLSAAWTYMFANVLYRWAFQNFPFFATLSVTAFIVLIVTVALSIICRVHFGKGLPQYLKTEETFDDSSFIPVIVSNKRQSKFASVMFPDKRTSALRKSNVEQKIYNLNPYDRMRQEKQSAVIDIKADYNGSSSEGSDFSDDENEKYAIGGAAPVDKVTPERKSTSNGSRLGKLSRTLSTFTSSSTSSDVKGDLPHVPAPPLPAKPVPARSKSTRSVLTKSSSSRLASKLGSPVTGSSTRASGMPTITVIPSTFVRGSPPRHVFGGGLPVNPRAYLS